MKYAIAQQTFNPRMQAQSPREQSDRETRTQNLKRSRSQWQNAKFFFIVFCYLPYFVSQLSKVWSEWNSICRFNIPLVDLCSNFIKIELMMTSLWRHLSFLQTRIIVHISYSIEPTHFVLRTNTQQHNVHLITKIKVTLTDDEGHRRRSKVTKNELMVICLNFYTQRHHTWYQGTIW